MSEIELCTIIKESNLFPGFNLHEEVGISGVSVDMVYEDGNRIFSIEAKTELNYKVFAQACRWRDVVTASYVAVPIKEIKNWCCGSPKKVILEELGLGIIVVSNNDAIFLKGYNPFEDDTYATTLPRIYQFPADWDYQCLAYGGKQASRL